MRVPEVARLGVEPQLRVLAGPGVQRRLQPIGLPLDDVVCLRRRIERLERADVVADAPGTQEGEDAGAHERGERLRVARDVGQRRLGSRRAQFGRTTSGERLAVRIAHPIPLVLEARVDGAQQRLEIQLHLAHVIVLDAVRHGLAQHLVDAVQVPEQQAL